MGETHKCLNFWIKRAQTSWQLWQWWDSKSPKSQTGSQQRPWNPATETELAAPRPRSESQTGCWNPKASEGGTQGMIPSAQGQEQWEPGRNQNTAWLWRAAGILVRIHKQSSGLLRARQGLEGNPALPKSGPLKSHPAVFLIKNILFQSSGTLLGRVSGLGLIPVQNWAQGLAESARTQGRGHTGAQVDLDISPQFLVQIHEILLNYVTD